MCTNRRVPALACLLIPFFAAHTRAEDQVVLRQGNGRVTVVGEIIDYTGASLTIQLREQSSEKKFRTEDVLEVATDHLAEQRQGREKRAAGELDLAEKLFESALKLERREWVRREILSELVACSLANDRIQLASERFLLIMSSDPKPVYLGVFPASWTHDSVPAATILESRRWIKRKEPLARVLAASHLLLSDRDQQAAEKELRDLSYHPDETTQRLAQAQLWRMRINSPILNDAEVLRWEKSIDDLPPPVRWGPTYVVAMGYLGLNQPDRAAATILWVPLVYKQNQLFAARCSYLAGEWCETSGQHEAALSIWGEAAVSYRGTPWGDRSKKAIADRAK